MIVEALAAALICLDPGHGTPPAVGRQREPIGPGSRVYKIKDGGGAAGEAEVVLQIAQRTRSLLLQRGYRVAMTRTGPTFRYGSGGNVARAEYCNRRGAALMLRIHADGSTNSARRGASTLYPALRRGWTDDVYGPSLRAARSIQRRSSAPQGPATSGSSGAVTSPASTGRTCPWCWSRRASCRIRPKGGFCARPRTSSASPEGLTAGVAAFT